MRCIFQSLTFLMSMSDATPMWNLWGGLSSKLSNKLSSNKGCMDDDAP